MPKSDGAQLPLAAPSPFPALSASRAPAGNSTRPPERSAPKTIPIEKVLSLPTEFLLLYTTVSLVLIRLKANSYFASARILMTMEYSKSDFDFASKCVPCALTAKTELCIIAEYLSNFVLLCVTKNTRGYIRIINISRPIDGEFHLLLQDHREMDQELFFKYFRMNSQRFDQLLLLLIKSKIDHNYTHQVYYYMSIILFCIYSS